MYTPVKYISVCSGIEAATTAWHQLGWKPVKPADQTPDGPRYKALGNFMAVPVMRWIGERLHRINSMLD